IGLFQTDMASIEVSLSTTPRRKKNGSIGGNGGGVITAGSGSAPTLHQNMKSVKSFTIQVFKIMITLKGQLCSTLSISRLSATYLRQNNGQPLTEKERRAAEERLQRLRQDMDNKRLTIKNLKMALERLDITDNIDVRIQQAELEYQLGREELNLLTLLEESRNLQICLEDEHNRNKNDASTIY
ncbi:hypothetical protein L9F63_017680, partial [Diploptera punctata]